MQLLSTQELKPVSEVRAEDKTAEDVVEMVSNRIRDWAEASEYGQKKKGLGVANLVVRRGKGTSTGDYLAIKIANKTFGYVPFSKSNGRTIVDDVLKSLPDHKEGLFNLYKEVCKQIRKPKGTSLELAN